VIPATPAVWAALALLVWSVVAIANGTDGAPPPSVVVVIALGAALAAARNRRMRVTGRLLLAFLAVIFVTALLGESVGAVSALGLAIAIATGLLALVELVRGPRPARPA
jgi:hypothetical protein